jgi:predicted alpha/beta-fold hydrolase
VNDRIYRTADDVQVLVREQRPSGTPVGEIVLLHGLEGSSEAGYLRSMAQASLDAGFVVHRMNIRSCGGTEHLCKTLYHAGLTADLRVVLQQLAAEGRGPVWIGGYSLGGNVALKLAGELGDSAVGLLRGAFGVSTPIDLAACVVAMERWENRLYEWNFLRRLKRRMRVRNRAFPDLFPIDGLDRIRSVREFDDRITGPFFGFSGAAEYYGTQSAIRFVDRIRVPTLMLSSQDDPLVPFEVYFHQSVTGNQQITVVPVAHGGHLGFLAKEAPVFWLDDVIVDWIREQSGRGTRPN